MTGKAAAALAGKKVKCRRCAGVVLVPPAAADDAGGSSQYTAR
jgi:hypothetical protein